MSGKDVLALLVMVVPGFLLIALIALTVVPSSVLQPFPGSGLPRGDSRKPPDPQFGADKAMRKVSLRAAPETATQKRMRNPWERQSYAKNLKASAQ